MVAIDTTRSAAPALANRVISALFSLAADLRAWNDARVTRRELGRLTARELDDIGLTFGDIDEIIAGNRRA